MPQPSGMGAGPTLGRPHGGAAAAEVGAWVVGDSLVVPVHPPKPFPRDYGLADPSDDHAAASEPVLAVLVGVVPLEVIWKHQRMLAPAISRPETRPDGLAESLSKSLAGRRPGRPRGSGLPPVAVGDLALPAWSCCRSQAAAGIAEGRTGM